MVDGKRLSLANSKNAFQVYSFVEAAIFLVVVGRAGAALRPRRAQGLPPPRRRRDVVILAAGLWVMFLVFYRQLDKPGGRHEGPIQTSVGVQWGIFVAFLLGALLAYAGFRIRAGPHRRAGRRRRPPDARPAARSRPLARRGRRRAREPPNARRARAPTGALAPRAGEVDVAATSQLSFDDPAAPPPRASATATGDEDPATRGAPGRSRGSPAGAATPTTCSSARRTPTTRPSPARPPPPLSGRATAG